MRCLIAALCLALSLSGCVHTCRCLITLDPADPDAHTVPVADDTAEETAPPDALDALIELGQAAARVVLSLL